MQHSVMLTSFGVMLDVSLAVHCAGQSNNVVCPTCPGGDAGVNLIDGATYGPEADGGMEAGSCPANEPSEGDVCSGGGFACWYGDSGRPDCRNIWECLSGAWHSTRSGCAQLPDGFCPTTEPDNSILCQASSDSSSRGDCVYPGGVLCDCPCVQTVTDAGAFVCGSSAFICYGPPSTDGCPVIAPNMGTPCTVQGVQCVYANPCDGLGAAIMCRAGVWSLGMVNCPL
jgi:hypothetical protein